MAEPTTTTSVAPDKTVVEFQRSAEEIKAGITGIQGEVKKLSATTVNLEERLARQEEFNQRNLRDNPDGKGGIRSVNLGLYCRGIITGRWDGADYEKKIYEESNESKRVLTSTPVGTGGGFVAAQYLSQELIEALMPQLVMRAMGARVISGLTGNPIQIPQITATSGPTAVLEGANKPNNEPTDALPTAQIHEIGVYVEVSRWLDIVSQFSMSDFLARDMVAAVLTLQDNLCLNGTGGAGQPLGLITELLATPASLYVMIGDIGNGALLVPEDIDNAITQQEQQNGTKLKVGWVMSPRTANRITNLRDLSGGVGTGQFMFPETRKRAVDGKRDVAGLPMMTTTAVPNNMVEGASGAVCSFAIYGDWAEQLILEWGGLDFQMSEHFAFRGNRKAFRCSILFDRLTRHVQSFSGIQGIL